MGKNTLQQLSLETGVIAAPSTQKAVHLTVDDESHRPAKKTAERPQIPAINGTSRPFLGVPFSDPAARANAAAAKAAKVAARRASALRRNFADAHEWERLARERGVRMPPWGEPLTTTLMRAWFTRLGTSGTAYLAWSGEKTLDDFHRRNPDWPARAWVGLLLEWQAGSR